MPVNVVAAAVLEGKETVFVTSVSFFRLVTSKNNFVMTTKLFMEIECLGYNDVIII